MLRISFLDVIWTLWKERNARFFEDKLSSLDSLIEKVRFPVVSWLAFFPQFWCLASIIRNWQEISSLPRERHCVPIGVFPHPGG